MKEHLRPLASCAVLVATLLLRFWSDPSPVSANHVTACQGSFLAGSIHRGATASVNPIGAEVKIENQTLDYCSGSAPRLNSAYASITRASPNGYDIIQMGVARCAGFADTVTCDGTNNVLYAWGREGCGSSDVPPVGHKVADPSGTQRYSVVKTSTKFSFQLDGAEKTSIGIGSVCWTPTSATYFGEAYDKGDAIGGLDLNHLSLSGAIYQLSGGWFSPSFTSCNYIDSFADPSIYQCSRINGQAIDLWTTH